IERPDEDAGDAVRDCVAPGFAAGILDERGRGIVEQDPIHTAIGGVERLHRYRVQAGAARERRALDAGDAIGDGDAGQAGAVSERKVPDAGDAVAEGDAGQAGAASERAGPDAGDAVGDGDAGQAGAAIERPGPDAGDAVGDGDAGQNGAVRERQFPDAGDRQAINRARDGHRTAGTVVSGDGDGTVTCQVIVLSL